MLAFTERERELGRLIAEGLTGPEISQSMQISESTVRNYIHRMGRLLPGGGPPMRRIALHFNEYSATGEESTG